MSAHFWVMDTMRKRPKTLFRESNGCPVQRRALTRKLLMKMEQAVIGNSLLFEAVANPMDISVRRSSTSSTWPPQR